VQSSSENDNSSRERSGGLSPCFNGAGYEKNRPERLHYDLHNGEL